jgi:hypothetical protein
MYESTVLGPKSSSESTYFPGLQQTKLRNALMYMQFIHLSPSKILDILLKRKENYATRRKVTGSISDEVIGFFN